MTTGPTTTGPTTVGILLFDGVDLLDSGGPYEVFLTADRLAERKGTANRFRVVTLTADGQPVTAYGGMGLIPQASAADFGPLDVVVVPGTIDVAAVEAKAWVMAAVRALSGRARITTSVCTGAFLLEAAGLLVGKEWTTHWEDIDLLAARADTPGVRDVRWVDTGDVITSAGLSAGIDMALHTLDRLAGTEFAREVANQIDHRWDPDPSVH